MTIPEIKTYLERYRQMGKKMFLTSSFQTHSIPLLHIVSTIDRDIPILFINTGFHFPETIAFRDEITERFGLNLIDVRSFSSKLDQRDAEGNFYFTSDPDRCCFLNKTQPLEPYLMAYDVWINGVRADQNANRKNMKTEQNAPNGVVRFHPVLDWTSKMIFDYAKEHDLPRHPLEDKGYFSVGCEPCTQKYDANDGRDGRWVGLNKTECGLHTDLLK